MQDDKLTIVFNDSHFWDMIGPADAIRAVREGKQKRRGNKRQHWLGCIGVDVIYQSSGKLALLDLRDGCDMLLVDFITGYCPDFAKMADYQGCTPLFYCRDAEQASALLALGADIEHIAHGPNVSAVRYHSYGIGSERSNDVVFRLLEHGAKTTGLLENLTNRGYRDEAHFQRYRQKVKEYCVSQRQCHAGVIAYIGCLYKLRIFPRDIIKVMAKLLWRTRRQLAWATSWRERAEQKWKQRRGLE